MSVYVEVRRAFTVSDLATGLVPKDIEIHTNEVLGQLYALESDDLTDVTLSVDTGQGVVEIEVYVRGESFDDAVGSGDAAIRSAIHGAGGYTPEWRGVRSSAELVDA